MQTRGEIGCGWPDIAGRYWMPNKFRRLIYYVPFSSSFSVSGGVGWLVGKVLKLEIFTFHGWRWNGKKEGKKKLSKLLRMRQGWFLVGCFIITTTKPPWTMAGCNCLPGLGVHPFTLVLAFSCYVQPSFSTWFLLPPTFFSFSVGRSVELLGLVLMMMVIWEEGGKSETGKTGRERARWSRATNETIPMTFLT